MENYSKRIKDIQDLLKENKLDAVIITAPKEIFFFTGFHQDRTLLLITKNDAIAFLAKMFLDHFKQNVPFVETFVYENFHETPIRYIKEKKLKNVVFDPSSETYIEGKYWISQGLKEFSGLVSKLRMIKENEELLSVRKACKIASDTFKIIKPKIKVGIKEIEISNEMEYIMKKKGAMGKSFDLIIAFGPNSAIPHHESSDRKLKKNEVVLMDFGCIYNRYCSDMTRTFFYGKPTEEYLKAYEAVDKAQKEGIKMAYEGTKSCDVDKASRDYLSLNGYGQYFIHSTGHGVGIDIHEEPFINSKNQIILKKGMIITVEPGVYFYGKFGIRIEDTLLVGEKKAEVLTNK